MTQRISLSLVVLVLMVGGFFPAYSMVEKTSSAEPWKISNRFMHDTILYVRIRGKETLVPTKASIKRALGSAYAGTEMEKDGTIKLDSSDTINYNVNEINFPIRGRIWTDKDKEGTTFVIADLENLLRAKSNKRYPNWLVNELNMYE